MYKTFVKNEQNRIRNKILNNKDDNSKDYTLLTDSIILERVAGYIEIYKNFRRNISNYTDADSINNIINNIKDLINISQECRKYLLEDVDIGQINCAIKEIRDPKIFKFFLYTFNPYYGAYDINENEIVVNEKGISKKLSESKFLNYDPHDHDLCYYNDKSKCFIRSRNFYNHEYLEKCRKNVRLNIHWEIIDIR